jgi:hypothetical protein
MRKLKHLSFDALVEVVWGRFKDAEDGREAGKVTYPLDDVLMSGLAMMYFQQPSLLACLPTGRPGSGRWNGGGGKVI